MKNTSKIYLDNTNLLYAVNSGLMKETNIGMVRETFFVNALRNANVPVGFSKIGDFAVDSQLFEIGGGSKTFSQLQDHRDDSFPALDDIVVGKKNTVPLYLFGLL
jgi:hypothetical protein